MDYVTEVARREAKAVERTLMIEIGKKHDAFLKDFRRKDRRASPVGSVTEDQHVTNGVSARALAEHSTNNLLRSVFRNHIGDGEVIFSKLAKPSVGTIELFDGNVTTPKVANEAITAGKLAKPSVGAIELFDLNVTNPKLAADAVTRSKVAAGTVGGVECGGSIKNAAADVFSLRTINNTAGAAAPFHVHSVLYKTWPKADRRRFLDVRRALEGYRQAPRLGYLQGAARLEELDRRLDTLAEALLGFYRIETDDPGMNAYDVEALLDDPSRVDEAKKYKDAHRMDDWEYEKGRDPIPEVAGRLEIREPGADGKERQAFHVETVKNFTRVLRGIG